MTGNPCSVMARAERQPHVSHAANSDRRSFFSDARPQGPVMAWLSFGGYGRFAASVEMDSGRQVTRHCFGFPWNVSTTRHTAGGRGKPSCILSQLSFSTREDDCCSLAECYVFPSTIEV